VIARCLLGAHSSAYAAGMPFLNLVLATKRAADVQGYCHCRQEQGEADVHGMVGAIVVPLEAPSEDDRVTVRVRQAWWEAHY
jgi:hypothetical protein